MSCKLAKVLKIAKDRGFDIPEPEKKKEEPNGPTVLTAFQKLLENEDKIKGDCLWDWRMQKPRIENAVKDGYLSREGESKAHKFLKQFKNVLAEIGVDYFDLHPLLLKKKDNKEEFSDEIKDKALDVLKNGDPVQYVTDSCKKMVLGADNAFKKLSCCTSVQNINQSAGLHPKLNGESSGGKTYTVYTFAHHMPKEAVIKGSMSAKAGFYHKDGNRVLRILDDYQAGNEDLDTVIKQTSSEFHAEYTHRTVANHEGKTLSIGSEQTWAITSVDASQEIQVLNRQMPINIDDSLDLTKKVNDLTIKRYADGERQYPVTETVLVSRCIFQILRDEGYIDVRIPFGDRIEWLDTTNRRNPSFFMDLVIAFTGMFRFQRQKDQDGYYLTTEDDFQAAKALFTDKDGEELVKRLTKKEREALEFLVSRPKGITQDDLADHLKVSRQRAGHILFGRDKERGGLMQKVQLQEERRSEMTKITNDHSQTIHKTIYSLKEYEKFAGFEGIVRLNTQQGAHATPATPHETPAATIGPATRRPYATNETKKEKEREEIGKELQASAIPKSSGLQENEKNGFNGFTGSHDADKHGFVRCSKGLHEAGKAPIDADNHGCIGPHPRRDEGAAQNHDSSERGAISVKFRTEYDTDIDGKMRHLLPGDVVEVSRERAEVWIRRGVAEVVSA